MAHSLEVRVPFLDHHLVEWAARIPTTLKVRHLTTKHLLKHAAHTTTLPPTIIDKRKIGFFRQASTMWLQAQLPRAVDEYLVADTPHVASFLDRDAVVGMARAGDATRTQLLLAILMLEIWLRTVVDGAPAAGRSPATAGRA